jgi:glycosyltransferase involved in cell wall biosynthesis
MRSLVEAIRALPDRSIEPVLFVSRRRVADWKGYFPDLPMVATSLVDHWTLPWFSRKLLQACSGREILLERLLVRNGISLYSHGAGLGKGAKLKTLGWIPDFQHLHLPEFFTSEICRQRDANFRTICLTCDAVVVSSEDVQKDLIGFCPQAASRVRVLRFVPQVPSIDSLPSRSELEARYGFEGPFFHLPNQFWKHKNHRVVIEALSILRQSGSPGLVLATGNAKDFRNPQFFDSLMAMVRHRGLERDFRPLGVVPFTDILALMHQASAVLNPSMFEGWSTTVEEAKCLGARVILSDIPVHREQAPAGALYFPPQDAELLSAHMKRVLEGAGLGEIPARSTETAYRNFGLAYEQIVMDLLRAT